MVVDLLIFIICSSPRLLALAGSYSMHSLSDGSLSNFDAHNKFMLSMSPDWSGGRNINAIYNIILLQSLLIKFESRVKRSTKVKQTSSHIKNKKIVTNDAIPPH